MMKKVLIVDDQTLNQVLLQSYLNQYCETNDEEMEIHTAANGLEALQLCEKGAYDLIFMDILMPTMDGIEATKRISAMHPHSIIVIVSTEDDNENQIKALRTGAKDYIVKPIHPDVFKHRIKLYLNILNGIRGVPVSKHSHNLFTNAVFCYKTVYLIEDEEGLAQLWESLMLKLKDSVRPDRLSDLIRFLYQLGIIMLSHRAEMQIIIEENEDDYFFSVLNVHILPASTLLNHIDDCFQSAKYLLNNHTLSFQMPKEYPMAFPLEETGTPIEEIPSCTQENEATQTSDVSEMHSDSPVQAEESYEKEAEVLRTFDFLEEEDLLFLEVKLNELASTFMWMGNNELSEDDVDQIVQAFERIASILLFYTDTQTLGVAIRDLAELIKKDEQVFIAMAPQMSALCRGFNNDLILWFRSLFFEGAPSVHFMDASILSNIQMIHSFLEPAEETPTEASECFEFF